MRMQKVLGFGLAFVPLGHATEQAEACDYFAPPHNPRQEAWV